MTCDGVVNCEDGSDEANSAGELCYSPTHVNPAVTVIGIVAAIIVIILFCATCVLSVRRLGCSAYRKVLGGAALQHLMVQAPAFDGAALQHLMVQHTSI